MIEVLLIFLAALVIITIYLIIKIGEKKMKQFDWEEFKKKKIAVHCKTEEEANNFLEQADKQKITWHSGEKANSKNYWYDEKQNTCYSFACGLSYQSIKYHKKVGRKIIEWSDYMQTEFKVGDRVKCIKGYFGKEAIVGMVGTVVDVFYNGITVQFDKYIKGHNGANDKGESKGKDGYCWNFFNELFGNVNEYLIPYKDNRKIVITTDGKTTTAKSYENGKLNKTARAKCSPQDEFDFETGAKLALERVFGFEVGDIVNVKDIGKLYSTYSVWVKKNSFENAIYYSYSNSNINTDFSYKIVAKAPHDIIGDMLYLIRPILSPTYLDQTCFLIGEDGLEKA